LALHRLAQVSDVDVIIVARGGGSLEDLWSFNEEIVARAIAACRVPVISAVGHETDFTIADFVADVRAPTPSVAGELAVPVASDLRAELALLGRRAGKAAQARLHQGRLLLERCRAKLGEPRRLLDERRQLLDELASRAHRAVARRLGRWRADFAALEVGLSRAHPHRRIGDQRAALERLREALARGMRRELQRRHSPIDALAHKLDALSPLRVLDRGYSLAFAPDGHLLTEARQVAPGDAIRVALRRGEIAASVSVVTDAGAPPPEPSPDRTPPTPPAPPSSDAPPAPPTRR
jgi:exodeoxyribonuclease VII large subunit